SRRHHRRCGRHRRRLPFDPGRAATEHPPQSSPRKHHAPGLRPPPRKHLPPRLRLIDGLNLQISWPAVEVTRLKLFLRLTHATKRKNPTRIWTLWDFRVAFFTLVIDCSVLPGRRARDAELFGHAQM